MNIPFKASFNLLMSGIAVFFAPCLKLKVSLKECLDYTLTFLLMQNILQNFNEKKSINAKFIYKITL